MEYKVIYVLRTISKFEAEVNQAIKEGWKPIGGVSITEHYFAQAMIRG